MALNLGHNDIMNDKIKYCLPEPIDGFIYLEPNVSYTYSQVLPEGVKIKLLPIDIKSPRSLAILEVGK